MCHEALEFGAVNHYQSLMFPNGGDMKTKTVLLTLALCFVAAAVCFASDVQVGNWKLNEAKSKLDPGVTKNSTVVYEATGDDVKVTVDGNDKDGKARHNEWAGRVDGKDYPVTGDPNSDTGSLQKVDDHTLRLTAKKGGKVTISGQIVLSADGKTRTVTTSGPDSEGKKFKNISVYDRQ